MNNSIYLSSQKLQIQKARSLCPWHSPCSLRAASYMLAAVFVIFAMSLIAGRERETVSGFKIIMSSRQVRL